MLIGLIVAGTATAVLIATLVFTFHDGVRASRLLLWTSFLIPPLLASQNAGDATVSVGPAEAARFGIPLLAGVVAVVASKPQRRGFSVPELSLALFLAVVLLSASWAEQKEASLLRGLTLIIQWVDVLILVRRYPSFDSALNGFAAFCQSLLVSVPLGFFISPTAAIGGGASVARLTGVVPSLQPNILGLVAVVALLSAVCGKGFYFIRTRAALRTTIFVLAASELVFARTRLALVAAVILVGIVLVIRALQTSRTNFILAAAGGVAALFASQSPAVSNYLVRDQNADQITSLSGRTDIWSGALSLWREQPWIGWGYYSGHRYTLNPVFEGANQSNLDNMWVEVLVDVGIIGLIPLALLVLSGSMRVLRRGSGLDLDGRLFSIAITALFAAGTTFNPSLQANSLAGVLFGFLLVGSLKLSELSAVDLVTPDSEIQRNTAAHHSPSTPPARSARA